MLEGLGLAQELGLCASFPSNLSPSPNTNLLAMVLGMSLFADEPLRAYS